MLCWTLIAHDLRSGTIYPPLSDNGLLRLTITQDRPCARCVKRSIGHLCHDEPRESMRGVKYDTPDAVTDKEQSVKQEEPLSCPLPSSMDQQQAGQQSLQVNERNSVPNESATPCRTGTSRFPRHSTNSIAQGSGEIGEKSQQCENLGLSTTLLICNDICSSWL